MLRELQSRFTHPTALRTLVVVGIIVTASALDHAVARARSSRRNAPSLAHVQNAKVDIIEIAESGYLTLRPRDNPDLSWSARLGGVAWTDASAAAIDAFTGDNGGPQGLRLVVDSNTGWRDEQGVLTVFLWDDSRGMMLNAELIRGGFAVCDARSAGVYAVRLEDLAAGSRSKSR